MITFDIALRNVFRHKTRSIITLSAIAFGCIALIFAGGYFEDILYKMRESYIHGHTGHLQIFKKGFFENGSARPFDYLISNPEDITTLISSVRGVKYVTSRLDFSGLLSTGETTISFVGQGVEPDKETAVPISSNYAKSMLATRKNVDKSAGITGVIMEAGEPLKPGDAFGVIAGRGLAAGIGVKPGDGLIIVTNTVGGSINAVDVNLKGVFFTSSKTFDDHFLRLPVATAQKLLHTDSIQSLVVMLDRTDDTVSVKKKLDRLFSEKGLDLEVKTWDTLNDFYTKTVDLFNRLFLILKIVIAIIAILSIFNTMNMAAIERTSEIGTLMAIGSRRRGVLKLFLYEGLMLGTIGGVIGVIAGVGVTSFIAYVGIPMPPAPGTAITWFSEPIIVWSGLIFAFFLSIITALISSLYPAYKASRLEIAEALRRT